MNSDLLDALTGLIDAAFRSSMRAVLLTLALIGAGVLAKAALKLIVK